MDTVTGKKHGTLEEGSWAVLEKHSTCVIGVSSFMISSVRWTTGM